MLAVLDVGEGGEMDGCLMEQEGNGKQEVFIVFVASALGCLSTSIATKKNVTVVFLCGAC